MPANERELIEGQPVLIVVDIQGGGSAHRRDLIDFGRELDGAEDIHLLEGDPGTEISPALGVRPDDYVIRKRRYSCFFGTELEILLKGPRADARSTTAQVIAAFQQHKAQSAMPAAS